MKPMRRALAWTLAAALIALSPGSGPYQAFALDALEKAPQEIAPITPALEPRAASPAQLLSPEYDAPAAVEEISIAPVTGLVAPQMPVAAAEDEGAWRDEKSFGNGSGDYFDHSRRETYDFRDRMERRGFSGGSRRGGRSGRGGGGDWGRGPGDNDPNGDREPGWFDNFKEAIKTGPAGIALAAAIGLGIGGGLSHRHEAARAQHIPLGFSEIHQIERDAERAGMPIEPMTRYLTSTNDLVMKIFESSNEAHENGNIFGNFVHSFAFKLDQRMEPTLKFHRYEVFDFLRDLPAQSGAALAELAPFVGVMNEMHGVNGSFSAAWDASHYDHYHTEYYTETEYYTDSNGRSQSRTVTKSREVYDYTTHTYDYHKNAGEAASSALDAVLSRHDPLEFREHLHVASQTNAEGEYAARKSRPERDRDRFSKDPKKRMSNYDFQQIANTWASGSTLKENMGTIMRLWASLHGDANSWRAAKQTAHDESYRTYSHSDSGPAEYQSAEKALSDGQGIERSIGEIVSGIEFTKSNVPPLEAKIRQLIKVELHYGKDGNAKALTREIMSLSKEIYQKNFKAGFDIEQYRIGMVLLFGLLGAAIMGFAALGAQNYFARRDYY